MQIKHKTEKGTILFVKVPDDASDLTYPKVGIIDLYFQTKEQSKLEEDNYISIVLPDVGFKLIGFTSEVTEETAKGMVNHITLSYYKNYIDELDCRNALDSFKSLMQHLHVYEVNPYEKPKFSDEVHPDYIIDDYNKWEEAELKCGKWIVLFKPND